MKKYLPLIIPIVILLMLFSFVSFFFQTGHNDKSVVLEIKSGQSVQSIASLLRTNNVISSRRIFKSIVNAVQAGSELKAGRYEFKPHSTVLSVLLKLKNGEILPNEPIRIVFPEGTSIYKMGTILEKAGYPGYYGFREFTNSNLAFAMKTRYPFLNQAKNRSFEGFLFPDTYLIDISTSEEALSNMMLDRFEGIIWKYWQENRASSKLSFYETLILASIIEKEAKLADERPIISSVFYNRINMRMPLAADPTVKYALERPTKRVYLNQVNINSPYNTYKRRGLPPTPICNPGLDAFKAAVYPAKTNYIYFVAKKDGSHIFSNSWDKHQEARQKISR